MTLKLLVDKKAQKVLFAEATKEFVDFLFQIFSLPLGTLIQFLGPNQMVGCLGQLKQSLENLNETFLQPGIDKDVIFSPKMAFNGNMMFSLLNEAFADDDEPMITPKTIYRCGSCDNSSRLVSEDQNRCCPACADGMTFPLEFLDGPTTKHNCVSEAALPPKKMDLKRGFVKDEVTFMVMDDLVVKPMPTISNITLIINTFGVKDLTQLEEKTWAFGKDEALKLLKASLMTDQVLIALL